MKLRFVAIMRNNKVLKHESRISNYTEERDYIKSFIEYAKVTADEDFTKVKEIKLSGSIIIRA